MPETSVDLNRFNQTVTSIMTIIDTLNLTGIAQLEDKLKQAKNDIDKLEKEIISYEFRHNEMLEQLSNYKLKHEKTLEQLRNCQKEPLHRPDQTEAGLAGEKVMNSGMDEHKPKD